jgi:hypothetical protein
VDIQILEIRPQNSGRPLRAFVDIAYEGLTIRDFRIVKEDGKPLTVVCPQVSWKDKSGFIKYKTVITLPPELKGEADRLILNAYAQEMENHYGNPT